MVTFERAKKVRNSCVVVDGSQRSIVRFMKDLYRTTRQCSCNSLRFMKSSSEITARKTNAGTIAEMAGRGET